MHPRVGFLTIGRKRPGFDTEWGRRIESVAWEAAGQWDLEATRPATRVVDDATLRIAVAELRAAECETLVVMQPIMGDGRLAPILAQLWDGPLVFWATPERQDSEKVSSCSLVGTHVFATILRQLDRPFELAYGHPTEDQTRVQVERAVRVCAAAARLRRSKVGVVGSHAPGFINMHADPAALSRTLGVQLQQFGLRDFYELVESCSDHSVQEDLSRVEELSLPFDEEVMPDDLTMNSRYYLAMQTLLDQEHLDALALRCWPELPNVYGAWPYLAMARLAGEGRIIALEGDVDGAVSCLIGQLLGVGTGYLTDWLEHAGRRLTMWHPGHAPPELCVPGSLRLGRHFNTGHPLVLHGELAPDQPITLFRLWRCDGRYHMTAVLARTQSAPRTLSGAHGVAVLENVDAHRWFENLCHAGMPHHLIVFQGHHTDLLRRMARMVHVNWVDASR